MTVDDERELDLAIKPPEPNSLSNYINSLFFR